MLTVRHAKSDKVNPFLHHILSWVLRRVTFHITGVISLPYAEIKEPFEAWFDLTAKSSRIDYYHGKNPPKGKRTDWRCILLSLLGICDVKLRTCCCKNICQSKMFITQWSEKKKACLQHYWFLLQDHVLAPLPFSLNCFNMDGMSVQWAEINFYCKSVFGKSMWRFFHSRSQFCMFTTCQ